MKKHTLTLIALLVVLSVKAQIIDVHLHSYTDTDYWGGRTHPTGIDSPKNADEHLARTIALMDKHQIEYAVVSGSMESVEKYVLADARFIPGYMDSEELLPIDTFEQLIKGCVDRHIHGLIAVKRAALNFHLTNEPRYVNLDLLCRATSKGACEA